VGLKIIDGQIYVLGRDQITRLHDLNGDGEADFYENFNNASIVTERQDECNLGLETDSDGNFISPRPAPAQPLIDCTRIRDDAESAQRAG